MNVFGRDNDRATIHHQPAVQTRPAIPIADRRSKVLSQDELDKRIKEVRELTSQAREAADYSSSTDDRDGALIVSAEPPDWGQWKVAQLLTKQLMGKKRARTARTH